MHPVVETLCRWPKVVGVFRDSSLGAKESDVSICVCLFAWHSCCGTVDIVLQQTWKLCLPDYWPTWPGCYCNLSRRVSNDWLVPLISFLLLAIALWRFEATELQQFQVAFSAPNCAVILGCLGCEFWEICGWWQVNKSVELGGCLVPDQLRLESSHQAHNIRSEIYKCSLIHT